MQANDNLTKQQERNGDAVIWIHPDTLEILHQNAEAYLVLGDAIGQSAEQLLSAYPIRSMVTHAIRTQTEQQHTLTTQNADGKVVQRHAYAKMVTREQHPAVALTFDALDDSPERSWTMQTILRAAYFLVLRIDLRTMQSIVLSSQNTVMQEMHGSYPAADMMQTAADLLLHPDDRKRFLLAFSAMKLNRFALEGQSPTLAVRYHVGDDYRWGQFVPALIQADTVLLLGHDAHELHMEQEQTSRYRKEIKQLSKQNDYILQGITDIFRLMFHVDLQTGETVMCSLHPSLEPMFSYDKVYDYDTITGELMKLVHPEDTGLLKPFSKLSNLQAHAASGERRLTAEYRRVRPNLPLTACKWTRAEMVFTKPVNGVPTEAFYVVLDVHKQKLRELELTERKDALTAQIQSLIRNRYLWFIEVDYTAQTAKCYRVKKDDFAMYMECPFSQFFEKIIMPNCHPEDYRKLAAAVLPDVARANYLAGQEQVIVEYRHRIGGSWHFAKAELYFQTDANGGLHFVLYVSDINEEVRNRNALSETEHDQLMLRRKFGLAIQDSYIRLSEIDVEADRMYHYVLTDGDYRLEADPIPFSRMCKEFPDCHVHPSHREKFRKQFAHSEVLRSEYTPAKGVKMQCLLDLKGDGNYIWTNVVAKPFTDENGKRFVMTYIEDINTEMLERNRQVKDLESARRLYQETIRGDENERRQRAHQMANLLSSFHLILNRIYGSAEHIMQAAQSNAYAQDLATIYNSYDQLRAMADMAKTIILMENQQLKLLQEPVSLPKLLYRVNRKAQSLIAEKQLHLTAYTTNLKHETVISDFGQLEYLLHNIFMNVLRTLPERSHMSLQIAETALPQQHLMRMYEFTLCIDGDRVSQDLMRTLCAPMRASRPIKVLEQAMLHTEENQQHQMMLCKRLLYLMHGELVHMPLPDQGSAVVLRLPLRIREETPCVFPYLYYHRKQALVWELQQSSAQATMKILEESGMQMTWTPTFEQVCGKLKEAAATGTVCSILAVRQSILNARSEDALKLILEQAPDLRIIVMEDASSAAHLQDTPQNAQILRVKTPLFRSVMAKALKKLAE